MMQKRCEGHYPLTTQEINRWWFVTKGLLPSPDADTRALGDVPDPPDWRKIDANLAEAMGWSPQHIDQMTLPEISAICMGQASADWQLVELYQKLDPAERLELALYQREQL